MDNSRKTQAKRLSETIDNFDTVLEQDPQRVIQYQAQPASPHQNLPIFPSLPPTAHLQWTLLLLVHLIVLWAIKKK